jgi:hypothetical protein
MPEGVRVDVRCVWCVWSNRRHGIGVDGAAQGAACGDFIERTSRTGSLDLNATSRTSSLDFNTTRLTAGVVRYELIDVLL